MTLKQLEYFLEIAKMASVTRAAQNLNISQPPLSMQLKALEDELGASLFIRDKRCLIITPEGELLKERAMAILELLDETARDIRAISETKETTIRIGTIGSINNRLLPELIARFCRDYPYVNFQVVEGRTDTVLKNLADGTVDLGFVREPFNMTELRSVPVQDPFLRPGETDYFVTIAQPQFYDDISSEIISLKDLRDKPLVIHSRYRDMILSACRKQGFNPHIICENGEIQSSLSWARAGIGIAIVPYTSAAPNSEPALIIRRLDALTFNPRVCFVWNRSAKLRPEAIAFINLMSC